MKPIKDRRRYLKYIAIILLAIFLVSIVLLLLKKWEEQQGSFDVSSVEENVINYQGKEYILKENVETFLVLGLDTFEQLQSSDNSYKNDKQADFLMLLVFDNNAKKFSAIHINRDTMARVKVLDVAGNRLDTVTQQISLAHTYGNGRDVSCHNVSDSVSDLLYDVRVNHYISFTMDSVAVLNDLVGGVEVNVLDDFTGIDDTLIKGENVTLIGEHALNYVRSRYGLEDSSNSSRMLRQKQYIDALYEKALLCMRTDEEFLIDASIKMSEYIVSDRSVTQLQELAEKFESYTFLGIKSIEGESKMGENYIEFYPDSQSIEEIVIDLFYQNKE